MFFRWGYSGMILSLACSILMSFATLLVYYLEDCHAYAKSFWMFVAVTVPSVISIISSCQRKQQEKLFENIWPLNITSSVNIAVLLLQSFLMCSGMLLQYSSLQYVSLVESSTIVYASSPILASVLAYFFLGESFGIIGLLSTFTVLAGVVCITRPPFLTGDKTDLNLIAGSSFALTSTILASLGVVLVRYLKNVHYSLLLFAYGFVGMVESLTLALSYHVMLLPTTPADIALTFAMGILSCGAQVCSTLALQAENVGPVSLVRTLDVVFAFIWQIIFLHKMPDFYSVLGGNIVLLGVLLAAFRKYIDALDETHSHRRWFGFVLK